MHRATVLLRVSTVVEFCAALIGGGAVGAQADITASVPAGVHWREGCGSVWDPPPLTTLAHAHPRLCCMGEASQRLQFSPKQIYVL